MDEADASPRDTFAKADQSDAPPRDTFAKADQPPPSSSPPPPPVDWRRNLLALWIAQFAGILGITAMTPFIALFLAADLHVRNPAQLALWTGACAAASGLGQALSSPVWGAVGDRVGRKPMLLRATFLGGAVLVLSGFAQTPLQLLLLRLAYGLLGQPRPIAQALVATETPREHAARAMGTLGAAISLGAAVGPGVGGLAGALVGVRAVFILAGALLVASAITVVFMVFETARPRRVSGERRPAALSLIPRDRRPLLAVLLAAQLLQFTVGTAVIPLMSLRLLALAPHAAALVTGLAFAASGGAGAIAGLLFGRTVERTGYRRAAITSSTVVVLALVTILLAPNLPVVLGAYAVYGFASAFMLPVTNTLLGLETPAAIHSTVFGIGTTAQAIGIMTGPLLGGSFAAYAGSTAGFAIAAALAAALAALVTGGLREPGPAAHTVS